MKSVVLVQIRPQKLVGKVIDSLAAGKFKGVNLTTFAVSGEYDLVLIAEYENHADLTGFVVGGIRKGHNNADITTHTLQVFEEYPIPSPSP